VRYKSSPQDLLTEADEQAEEAIVKILRRSRPCDSILTEESVEEQLPSDSRWMIDPLDGTTNFVHGYPHFSVSIAYEYCGRVELGIILDALSDECYFAQRGKGAHLSGKPIAVNRTRALADSLLGTGFPYDQRERRDFYLRFGGYS
jgi:myo-inositol-1(or 4)-monophosphatase